LSTIARVFDIKPGTLYKWYRNHLSDFKPDIENGIWPVAHLEKVDVDTGEVVRCKPLYVFKPENIGEKMCIDDKAIKREGYTIFSNAHNSKIALMIESCKSDEVSAALSMFGKYLLKVRSVSCDMAAGYLKVCSEQLPDAKVVIDKFHVIRYVYDAVLEVRIKIKKELTAQLSKGKKKTEEDRQILRKIDLLRRCRNRLTQSSDKWSEVGLEVMTQVFINHNELKIAYDLAQTFKQWYAFSNPSKPREQITGNLHKWYHQVIMSNIVEFKSVIKMIRKHEDEILNYFDHGHTNAKAERINGNINRFISSNYGIKDKIFALYRMAGYFS
jgi:transposase